MTSIAVLFVHGVEVPDPNYATTAIRTLRSEITRIGGRDALKHMHVKEAYWKPAVSAGERSLFANEFRGKTGNAVVSSLNRMVHEVNVGRTVALLPLALSGLFRSVLGHPELHWPTMRWAVTTFVGDVIAYQQAREQPIYQNVHARIESALVDLAERAGPDAPLCVIAHSLGTVIASDHFYDLARLGTERTTQSPLVRGETLAFFYTLGSPIALWTVRHPQLDRPIPVPAIQITDRALMAAAEWVNFYDPDDIVAFPLKMISAEYSIAVKEDLRVAVGPPLLGASPASHVAYWNDPKVMRRIAHRLAPLLSTH